MMARSHVLVGMASWATIDTMIAGGSAGDVAALGLASIGALLPDIDHPGSTLGRLVPFISLPLAAIVGHRGVTHSIIGIGAVLAAMGYWGAAWFVWPLGIGYVSHVAADMVTPSGCPLLWPSRRSFSFNLWRSGAMIETLFAIGVGAALVWFQGGAMIASAEGWISWALGAGH